MKVQRGRRGEQEKGECWEVLETAERGVRESKQDSVGWETFLSLSVCLSFCFAWPGCAGLACLPACLACIQPRGDSGSPWTTPKPESYDWGWSRSHRTTSRCSKSRGTKKARKTALICPLFLSSLLHFYDSPPVLPPSFMLPLSWNLFSLVPPAARRAAPHETSPNMMSPRELSLF